MILFKLQKLECLNSIDLTGKPQHGFKQQHSTATAVQTNQSLLVGAHDGGYFALMAGLDLSLTFDVVNLHLLIKRLTIVGIPKDIVNLISEWLKDKCFYVTVGENSYFVCSQMRGQSRGPSWDQ